VLHYDNTANPATAFAAGHTTPVATPRPDDDDGPLTVCHACGRPFKGGERWTIAAWFIFGSPRKMDCVHLRCRHTRIPFAVRERRRLAWHAARAASKARRAEGGVQ